MGKEVSLMLNTISECYPELLFKSARFQSAHLETGFRNLSLQTFARFLLSAMQLGSNPAPLSCAVSFLQPNSLPPQTSQDIYSFMLSFSMFPHFSFISRSK